MTREMKRLKLEGLSFHGLRYAAAARLKDKGFGMEIIMDLIGHSTYRLAVEYALKRARSTMSVGTFY